MNRTRQHLADILTQIERLQAIEQRGYEKYLTDVDTRAAAQRYFEIIGEVVKRLPDEMKAKHPDIQWRKIAGMRDIIVHDYDIVMDDTLWETIGQYLPALKVVVFLMQDSLSEGD